ncbi:MAG: alpha/beta hydrolase [Pseudomonadota bacterium]
MPRIAANGIEIEYDEMGAAADPAILLVMGFSSQMTRWPDAFKRGLAGAGRRVVWFDNRDIGLSTEFAGHAPPNPVEVVKAVAERGSADDLVPYLLDDMAADAAGLLDALGIDQADVLGVSMGGMIVQLMALNHPGKVRKLIPVMTTSGDPSLPPSSPEALEALTNAPAERTAEALAEAAIKGQNAFGSHPDVRNTEAESRAKVTADFHRSDRPAGVARQYGAILAQPRWHERLAQVAHPTLVLHGSEDTLIRPAAGEDIARRIPGARYVQIDKWGHDLADKMMPALLDEIIPFLEA